MSSKKLSAGKRSAYENEFSEFLLKKIGNAGGSIQLQHITGHMSQLRHEIRTTIGTSISDLKQFLREHPNLFCLDSNIVSLANAPALTTTTSGYDSDDSSVEPKSVLPPSIHQGKGVIIKLFPSYGFIKSKDPIKTEIYFKSRHCGDPNFDLTSFLYIGANVYFDAHRNDTFGCKYTATTVRKADNSSAEENAVKLKPRKTRETGLYDPLTLDGEGIIQKVFPNLGFIAVNGDDTNTVFFYKSRVVNYNNIVDLTKILSKGDAVEFNAHRSTKSDAKARWEATKVWKKKAKVKQITTESDYSECTTKPSSSKDSASVISNKGKEMIRDQRGKICPRSHGAVIKFGKNELADGDSAPYFVCGSQVTEISWEFSEGDDVKFDAVKIKSAPGWKAVLVWVGEKPNIVLPTCLGDFSEFTDEENEEISSSLYTSKSSSCLSINSSSSFKSMSMKSESISSKKDSQICKKEKTSKLSNTSVNEKVRNYEKSNIHPSQNNFSSHSKNFQDFKKDDESYSLNNFDTAVSDWGDSPYPDDDSQNVSLSKCYVSDNIPVENIHYNVAKTSAKENESNSASSEEENSDEELSNTEFASSALKNDIDDSKPKTLKEPTCIKKFQKIEGKITKVYSKFAEVKSCNLQKSLAFYWNDFYKDGRSVDELDLDDLKEVLKVGDLIYFNYFIIVDDSGQSWQKISVAWKGCKPRVYVEMRPEDFIKQNSLSVTINEDIDLDEVGDSVGSRKFLTSFVDIVPDQGDKFLKTESYTENDKTLLSVSDSKVKDNKTVAVGDFRKLSNTVCEILRKDVFSTDSKVDLYSISEEIVNIVLENCNGIKSYNISSNSLSKVENSVQRISNTCPKCRGKCNHFPCQGTKDCDVQTIITGEIIAQNIFTEC